MIQENREIAVINGVVTKLSKDGKTATVEISKVVRAGVYGKSMRRQTVVHAHVFPNITVAVGSKTGIVQSKRMSKSKSWRVV